MEDWKMYMPNKMKVAFICLVSFFFKAWALDTIPVVIKKTEIAKSSDASVSELDLLTVNGMRLAITKELGTLEKDQELFWKKIEEKKLSVKEEIELFKPLFTESSLLIPHEIPLEQTASASGTPKALSAQDHFKRASFQYEMDALKSKQFFDQHISNLPDVTLKSFYILADIGLGSDLGWSDVGVTKEESFVGVITDSWLKWVKTQFPDFATVALLEKDLDPKTENLNPQSVILKWKSEIKRNGLNADKKTGRYEVSAQFVFVNAKTNESLAAFDFPTQKREVRVSDPKELSSTLASLVFNLLNSQSAKITAGLELNKTSMGQEIVEVKVTGIHGLLDIYQLNARLNEQFKSVQLNATLKTFSSEGSTISLKSNVSAEKLFQLFLADGGKIPLSEQKILLFNGGDKTFAIIPK